MKSQSVDEILGLIETYISDVLSGRRVVGKYERLCVERHLRDLQAVESGERDDIRFNGTRGETLPEFFTRYVRHTKGQKWAGKRFRFSRKSAWQAFVLYVAFGWEIRESDGEWRRRFRVAYISVARKQGKTFLASGISLYMVEFDGEPEAEVYFFATKRDQAKQGWRQAQSIVLKSPARSEFRNLFTINKSTSTISTQDGSFCTVLGRNTDTFDSFNPSLGIGDELHAQKTREGWDTIASGQGARTEPMMLGITTAGSRTNGLCWELDRDAIRVLEGIIPDDRMFAFIARLDEGDDWADESVWPKANPNLGESVSLDDIRAACTRAKNNLTELNEFKRKKCNLWTTASTAWMPMERWDACAREYSLNDFVRMDLIAAIDLAKWHDFAAMVALARKEDEFYLFPFFWFPEENIAERVKDTRVPVDVWAEQGHIETTPGSITDQDFIVSRLTKLRERHHVREVPLDPKEAWKLSTDLQKLGFDREGVSEVIAVNQGFWLSGAMKEAEKLVREDKLHHDGNPVLRWMISNVVATTNEQGRIKPDKKRSGDCIDGAVAMIMAVGRAVALQSKRSVYETRDVREVG